MKPELVPKVGAACKHGLVQAFCALCNPSQDIQFSLTNFARRYSDLDSKELANKALERMTSHQQHRLLLSLLKGSFDNIRRAEVRVVERSASSYELERQETRKENARRQREARRERESFISETPWRAGYGKLHEEWLKTPVYSRKIRMERLEPEYAQYLFSQGIEDYIGEYTSYSLNKAFRDFETAMRKKVTLELTEELLVSSFSIADGKSVTWGEATVTEHKIRIDILLSQASGTVTTAKLHEEAIQMITARSMTKLNEVAAITGT